MPIYTFPYRSCHYLVHFHGKVLVVYALCVWCESSSVAPCIILSFCASSGHVCTAKPVQNGNLRQSDNFTVNKHNEKTQ